MRKMLRLSRFAIHCNGTKKSALFSFIYLLPFLLSALNPNQAAAQSELFISEYIEGSSNNKAIEIYNGTGAAINLGTAGYNIQMFFNGSATAGLTINLTGTVANNDVFVIAQSSAAAAILAQADQTNGAGWFNGDDAVVLRKGTTVIDVIGQIGFDPGTEWGSGDVSTADNTLRRKATVCSGDADGSNVFDPSAEWDGFATDNIAGLGSHTTTCGVVTPSLSINDVTLTEGDAGTKNFTFTVSLSVPAGAGGVTFDIATADNTASAPSDYVAKSLTGQTIPQTSSTYSFTVLVNGDLAAEADESFFVNITNVTGATVSDGQGTGTIQNDDVSLVKIHEVQGTGLTTPLLNALVKIEGIVTRTFSGSTFLNGFYVQEEDADADTDASTSEGIFVFDNGGLFTGAIGDKVNITGKVTEFVSSSGGFSSSLTELTNLTSVINLGAAALPTITSVQLPVTSVDDLERYEGMLVNMKAASGNLTVTETFQLGRFGQLVLAADGSSNQPGTDARFDQYTQFNAPSVPGNTAYLAEIAKRRIYLDDGRGIQNPDPLIFGRGGNPLSASNTLRGGDEVASLTGILDHRFEGYRIQTLESPDFIAANERPVTPPAVGGTLKIASMNVLNYFNGDGMGGGFPTSRGANTIAEFTRQRTKIINAIIGTGADVAGLMEIENDGYGANSAIQDLVNGLNAVAGAGTYSFINAGIISTDEITVALIYKPAAVTPVGASAAIPFAFGTGSFAVVGRRSLAQTFQENATGEMFTAVVNHLKSKGSSSGGPGDADAGDGQGASNGTRTRQAQDLAAWLATNPTGTTDPDYLLLGDLNAYAKEDPLTTLASAGFSNLLPLTSYSYVFDGMIGSLDHALGSAAISSQVTGTGKWHINADEPLVLDYNTEFKSAGQIVSFYNTDPFRASDHDPVLVGLKLCTTPTISNVAVVQPGCTVATGSVTVTASGVGTLEYSIGNDIWQDANAFTGLTAGNYTVAVRSKNNTTCGASYSSNPVTIDPAPLVPSVYNVSGYGGRCNGNNGNGTDPVIPIAVSGSQTGVNYQLLLNGVNYGSPVAGTGNPLSFPATEAGLYTVVATSTSAGACSTVMTGSGLVITKSTPNKFDVTGGGKYCAGGAGVPVGLSSSQTGVNYMLKLNNVNTGITVAGTGAAISFGLQTTGTYTVDAVNAITGCTANMNGSAVSQTQPCIASSERIVVDNGDGWAQVSPNPVKGTELQLAIHGMAGKNVQWSLITANGSSTASNYFITSSQAHRQKLTIPQLTPGMYLLKLQTADKMQTLKVMKID